jgi:hypothetical protein
MVAFSKLVTNLLRTAGESHGLSGEEMYIRRVAGAVCKVERIRNTDAAVK